jgi:hypothetical protein
MEKKILLIAGRINSGKNHAFSYLTKKLDERNLSVEHIFFARKLKDLCRDTFRRYGSYLNSELDIIKNTLEDPDLRARVDNLKITPDKWYEHKNDSTRIILQDVGTIFVRNNIDRDFWPKQVLPVIEQSSCTICIATDFRFPNEYAVLKNNLPPEHSLITLSIERTTGTKKIIADHSSEDSLKDFPFDYTISNTEGIKEFEKKLDTFIQIFDI